MLQPIAINTTDEVTGTEERMVINGLFDEECTAATNNKNETYSKILQMHNTRGAEE